MRRVAVAVLSISFIGAFSVSVLAQERGHWHDGDIRHFHEHDMARWHEGHWHHGLHGGHSGWWWVIDGGWYYYPEPVYPYPNPYIPPSVVIQQPAPAQYWYCSNPPGYYPYVPQCMTQWQPVSQQELSAQPPLIQPQEPSAVILHPQESQRDIDDRQLDTLAAEFYAINPKERNALNHLKDLRSRTEAFRQSLFTRNYNAMDILKNTEDLEQKIDRKQVQTSNRMG